jgi:alpha-D-xyloside xylohydrolase
VAISLCGSFAVVRSRSIRLYIIQHFSEPDGLIIKTSDGFIKLTVYGPNIIRVRYTLASEFSAKESLMIEAQPHAFADFAVQETQDNSLLFSTAELQVRINKKTGAFTYLDASGELLTKEPDRGGKTLVPIDVIKPVFDASAPIQTLQGADGIRVVAAPVKKIVDRQAYHTKLEFEWADDEALYGLGSHEEGMMNLRGTHQYLYQQNMKAVVPVLVSTKGYGIVLDSYSLMTFHDDVYGSYLWTDVDEELDYYLVYGPEFDQIIQGIRHLTGRPPMFPKWAFGYVQSKERYISQEELISIVREYRRRRLPLDCIVLDWKSWTGELWGQKTLDPDRFPDPKKMAEELHLLNARLMVSVWPNMYPGGDNWLEMRENGCLLGDQSTYNAFLDEARELYWKQANEGLFAHGIDAWWCDCTEPFQADWKDPVKPEPEERLRVNVEEAKEYLDPGYINAYSLRHSKGIYEGQRSTMSGKRVLNLTRSAYAGQHRYGTITWSGDTSANWETLQRQIPAGLNFCVTGSPYWTADIGAFFVKNKPELWFWSGEYDQGVEDLGYRELYVRWFQYAAFLPMFRSHGTDTPREVWRFGEPGDMMYDSLVKFLRLRYRLMPYIYSLAGRVTHEDYTLLRALPFDFRGDPATYHIGDQFMFGPAFLVNPVTHPMYYAAESTQIDGVSKSRSVYLPKGADWYDFWTGQRYTGGQTICADAALDIMPLYARSGSIVPIGPDITYVDEQPNSMLELHIYPGQNGNFTLYDDEGDNYHYEQGHFAMIRLSWNEANQRLTLHDRQGSYPGMPGSRKFRIVIGDGTNNHPSSEASSTRTVLYEGHEIGIDL